MGGVLNFGTIAIWARKALVMGAVLCIVECVQHRQPLPARCHQRFPPLPTYDNQKCLWILSNTSGDSHWSRAPSTEPAHREDEGLPFTIIIVRKHAQGPHLADHCCVPGACAGQAHSRRSEAAASNRGWGWGGMSPSEQPDAASLTPPSAPGTAAELCDSQRRCNFWNSPSLSPLSSHFHPPFSCQLGSGRASDEMTGSRGLCALCSGFYPPDFTQPDSWPPLSWRNVKSLLNHRARVSSKRTLITHPHPQWGRAVSA